MPADVTSNLLGKGDCLSLSCCSPAARDMGSVTLVNCLALDVSTLHGGSARAPNLDGNILGICAPFFARWCCEIGRICSGIRARIAVI